MQELTAFGLIQMVWLMRLQLFQLMFNQIIHAFIVAKKELKSS